METTDFCSYELSKRLKDCGFDEPCDCYYTNGYANDNPEDISRVVKLNNGSVYNHNKVIGAGGEHVSAVPLWQAQKWLREKKGIAINVIAHDASVKYREGKYHWMEVHLPNSNENGSQWMDWFIYGKHPLFDTFEEALSDGLSQMLELIKKGD